MLKARWSHTGRRPHGAVAAVANSARPRNRTPGLLKPSDKLWYVLHLTSPVHHDLAKIAAQCTQVTDYVSLAPPDAILLEVRGSLRYFGGVRNIRERLRQALHPLTYHEVISPSPAASLLLARHGASCLVAEPVQLRAALGQLPVTSLPLDRRTLQALQRCGLKRLQDLWRLPAAELRLRFGRPLHDYLTQLKGEQAQMPPRWQPSPVFEVKQEFDYPLSSTEQILAVTQPLLEQLEQFLKQRHLQTDLLNLTFFWEQGYAEEDPPVPLQLQIGTRLPGNSAATFALLLETRLNQLHLTSAVQALKVLVERYQPFVPDGGARGTLTDLLAARLGPQQVCRFTFSATHAPELASQLTHYRNPSTGKAGAAHKKAEPLPDKTLVFQPLPTGPDGALPPVWLLNPPHRLAFRNQRLFYQSFLQLIRGPQRIESLWWTSQRLLRDYYVAHNEQGMRLWIYRDLRKADVPEGKRWYLHGLFG